MTYFSIEELCHSDTATARQIDNTPAPAVRQKLQTLIDELLDPLRRAWGQPIRVSSGYRCPELNRAVGGVANSQHQTGEAADLTTGTAAQNRQLFARIIEMQQSERIDFDQLIWERGSATGPDWIHLSYRRGSNRRQVLYL
ncbi:D-Ala-D-Ala carboxypeptidase family metallohydrolase [Millionella massiliensis]|uniref:D-Ala-D-Ala carboxypeptidase family metallohydrolase n=1 Tax=Millionella massiliensis TaxID=1871023 RepID=UPI0008D97BBE|nr:D-Ala-D-Ala carboxypeptidase family metallohydrolase [Millionella massiliensis]